MSLLDFVASASDDAKEWLIQPDDESSPITVKYAADEKRELMHKLQSAYPHKSHQQITEKLKSLWTKRICIYQCATNQSPKKQIIDVSKYQTAMRELSARIRDIKATDTSTTKNEENTIKATKRRIIIGYNIIKGVYIFLLVPFHISSVMEPSSSIYLSDYLPFDTVNHGVEYMMGLLLISGWLSNMTFPEGQTRKYYVDKKLRRLLPAYILAMIPTLLSIICLHRDEWTFWAQFALDMCTVGGWNPMLIWWSANRPLWFVFNALFKGTNF